MSGLYNMIFGYNPSLPILVAALDNPELGRLRDGWVEMHEGTPIVAIYTRNGGGNRGCWRQDDGPPPGPDCDCPGCIQTYRIPRHPLYLRDEDDAFDSTYCTNFFTLPTQAPADWPQDVPSWEEVRALMVERAEPGPVDMSARWEEAIAAIGGGGS